MGTGFWIFIIAAAVILKYVKKNVSIDPTKLLKPKSDEAWPMANDSKETDAPANADPVEQDPAKFTGPEPVKPAEPETIKPEPFRQAAPEPDMPAEPEHEKPAEPAFEVPAGVDRVFGLIGKPLAQSHSRVLFKKKFHQEHISADYMNFELDSIDQLPALIKSNPKLSGLNVTIPYKKDVLQYLTSLDESASKAGAVNVIKVVHNGIGGTELIGYNTDSEAFRRSIEPHLEGRRKALILGTGGVSMAVAHAFDQLGVKYMKVSRNSSLNQLGYYELSPSLLEDYTIIVNCTPVGMYPDVDKCPDIPYTFLTEAHLLFDVICNPDETLFMKKGREHGATVIGGSEMFNLQAQASWKIWNS